MQRFGEEKKGGSRTAAGLENGLGGTVTRRGRALVVQRGSSSSVGPSTGHAIDESLENGQFEDSFDASLDS